MASSLVITINSADVQAQLNRLVRSNTDARKECEVLKHYFSRLESGHASANFSVQSSSATAVAAHQTVTFGTFSSLAAGDTVVVGGITLTCQTSAVTLGDATYRKVTDSPATAASLAAQINALATLNIYVTASVASNVVTITANQKGVLGNLITLTTDKTGATVAPVAGGAALAGGTGGATSAPTVYTRGY